MTQKQINIASISGRNIHNSPSGVTRFRLFFWISTTSLDY